MGWLVFFDFCKDELMRGAQQKWSRGRHKPFFSKIQIALKKKQQLNKIIKYDGTCDGADGKQILFKKCENLFKIKFWNMTNCVWKQYLKRLWI